MFKPLEYHYRTKDLNFILVYGQENKIHIAKSSIKESFINYFKEDKIAFSSKKELNYSLNNFYLYNNKPIPKQELVFTKYNYNNFYIVFHNCPNEWSAKYHPNLFDIKTTEHFKYLLGHGNTRIQSVKDLNIKALNKLQIEYKNNIMIF